MWAYGSLVTERRIERLGALAGLIGSLTVGAPVLLEQLRGPSDLLGVPAWLWWACYLGYLVAFVSIDRVPRRVPAVTGRRLLLIQTLLGGAVVAMAPALGWTPVLLVVTAVTAAYILSPAGAGLVIAGNSALLGVVSAAQGTGPTETAVGVAVYGSLQVFATLMVWSGQREARAREHLAEAHAELRAATALLAESTRADERVRIARELHDLVGHQLTALTLQLEVASHRGASQADDQIEQAHRTAKELLADVRAAVGDLRSYAPPLRSALEALTADLPGPRVHLHVHDDVDLDIERRTALVRCVQEIVTNARRHSEADNLWIEIRPGRDGETVLRARDDGRGTPQLELGNGLTGLRERIEQLGGAVAFDSTRGFGVHAEVPAS